MSKTTWAGVSGDAVPSFEKLRNCTSLAYNQHSWYEWIEALKLFVSRADPNEVIRALKTCRAESPTPEIKYREGATGWDIPG